MSDVIKVANNSQNPDSWKPEEFEGAASIKGHNLSLLLDTVSEITDATFSDSMFFPSLNTAAACLYLLNRQIELDRRLKNVEEFLKMEFGDKYNGHN